MNVPEKNRELAHAWVDGAKIQYETYGKWEDLYGRNPTWGENNIYRVDPLCEYAINKIPEHNREAYVHFHKGGEVEFLSNEHEWIADSGVPLFSTLKYRIKPKTVKRWQWLLLVNGVALASCSHYTEQEATEAYKSVCLLRKIEETEKEFPA